MFGLFDDNVKQSKSMPPIGKGMNFPPENPSIMHQAISYCLIVGLVVPSINVFMNLFNRTRLIGKKNLSGVKPPFILMSNHLTLLDDLFLGPLIFFPRGVLGYKYLPYHAPEERNFYKKPLIGHIMKYVKSIPVLRGNGIYQEGVNRLIQAVKDGGILHIYPEGTRTRTGKIGKAKSGIGRIVYETSAPVVPLYHQGLEQILPIGRGFPRIGKEVRIAIGKPLTFTEELNCENSAPTWKAITAKVMEAILEQKSAVEERWGEQPIIIESEKT